MKGINSFENTLNSLQLQLHLMMLEKSFWQVHFFFPHKLCPVSRDGTPSQGDFLFLYGYVKHCSRRLALKEELNSLGLEWSPIKEPQHFWIWLYSPVIPLHRTMLIWFKLFVPHKSNGQFFLVAIPLKRVEYRSTSKRMAFLEN